MRALLVDDQRMFRDGLCALLRSVGNVEIIGQAANAREAYELVTRLRPDLVMMELLLPGVDGVTAAREIRRLRQECKLFVLTACKDRHLLQAAWLSGIDACVTKDESVDTLLGAIASLKAGRRFISPSLRKSDSQLRILDADPRNAEEPLRRLSLRERVVFNLIVRGFTTKAVARELCISTKTVETHRAHINEKLAAHSTADLVRYAFRNSVPLALADGSASQPKRSNRPQVNRPQREAAREQRRDTS
jgi:DNA-binding NarL/FixJ family response regulator